MNIRIATLEDAQKIVEISQEDGYNRPLELQSIIDYIKHGDTYVLAEDDEPTGVAKLAINDHGEPELFVISVKLKFQRKGVGEKLLEVIENIAKKSGDVLVLHVETTNTKAQKFYKKHGFIIGGEVENLYQKGDHHYKMLKYL